VSVTPVIFSTLTFSNTSTGRTGTIQTWTVPSTGNYTIEAQGAGGGYSYFNGTSNTNPGGKGAKIVGTFSLTSGDVIKILVGQQGTDQPSPSRGGAGGGGTFVWKSSGSVLLITAGGGGGAGQYVDSGGYINGSISTSGNAGYLNGSISGAGGTSGGAGTTVSYGQGGAGWNSNGTANWGGGEGVPYKPLDATYPGYGASKPTSWSDSVDGGFGGGGCAYAGGGGGGGYSGGGGGGWSMSGNGGGGGSYNGGTNQTNTAGFRSGNGQVIINKI
jgi:hypothetical protein